MPTPPSPSPATSKVHREAVARAVEALLAWMKSKSKQRKAQLLEHDDLLYLVLTLKRIPSTGRINPHLIRLPHPLFTSPIPSSVCLIVDDRPRTPLTPSAARDLIALNSLPISDVIALSDLRADYRPYEARRRLCDSHDLFFADRRILPLLPRILGKHFFEKKKTPLAVDLARKGWPEQIKAALASTCLYLRTGTCSGIKVGRVSQSSDEIVDNIVAVIDGASDYIPRKWANVRSLHIKSVDSLALPIYQAVPESGFKISIEGFRKAEEKAEEPMDGEVIQMEEAEAEVVKSSEKKKMKKRGRIHEVSFADMLDGDDTKQTDDLAEKAGAKKKKKVEVEKKVEKKVSKGKKEKLQNGETNDDDAIIISSDANKKTENKGSKAKKEKLQKGETGDDNTIIMSSVATEKKVSKEKKEKLQKGETGDNDAVIMSSDAKKKSEKKDSKAKKEKLQKVETSDDDAIIVSNDAKKKTEKKGSKTKKEKLQKGETGDDDAIIMSRDAKKKKKALKVKQSKSKHLVD